MTSPRAPFSLALNASKRSFCESQCCLKDIVLRGNLVSLQIGKKIFGINTPRSHMLSAYWKYHWEQLHKPKASNTLKINIFFHFIKGESKERSTSAKKQSKICWWKNKVAGESGMQTLHSDTHLLHEHVFQYAFPLGPLHIATLWQSSQFLLKAILTHLLCSFFSSIIVSGQR